MKRKRIMAVTAAFLILLIIAGCEKKETSEFPDENTTYSEEIASLGVSNRFAGVVTASGETKVEKEEDKAIAELKVETGQIVKKDQLLFIYDSEQAQLNYDKAKLELDQLNYSLQALNEQKATLERDKAAAGQEEQLEYTISIQEVDTNIRETNYNITAKQKEVEKLEKGLENLDVKSPIDGKVKSINADGATDSSGNALPYIVLMNTGTYRVKAYINEINAMELYEGADVIVRSRVDDRTWTGKVASVDFDNPSGQQQDYDMGGSSDVSSSSKYPFYVDLDSADGLILGQHVFVEVDVEFTNPVPETGSEDLNDAALEGSEDMPIDMQDGDLPLDMQDMQDMEDME